MDSTKRNFSIDNGFTRVGIITGLVLLVPFVAMQLTNEVNWGVMDFIVMASLLLGLGSVFVWLSRRFPNKRLTLALLVAVFFVYLWAELAVGVFTQLGS